MLSENYSCIHLDTHHNVKTSKTIKTIANSTVLDGKINNSHRYFLEDPMHLCSNLIGLMTARNNIPFSMHDSDKLIIFIHHIPLKYSVFVRK